MSIPKDDAAMPHSRAADAPPAAVTSGPIPKHAQLRAILLADIGTTWPAHAAIPSERELTGRYGVSRATVREALRQLIEEQKLYTVQGKGTFVAGERVQSQLHLASFTEDMRRRGLVATSLVQRAEVAVPPLEVRATLGLDEGESAWWVERLRLAGGIPMALERGCTPAASPPTSASATCRVRSTGSWPRTTASASTTAEQTVWAETVDGPIAAALGVAPGAAVMVFRRSSRAGATPVEHVTSWYRGDRYQVHMGLTGS